jgi:ABC-type transport system involved in cytochrome bd biosynthesis fused ATPase/permease subunit
VGASTAPARPRPTHPTSGSAPSRPRAEAAALAGIVALAFLAVFDLAAATAVIGLAVPLVTRRAARAAARVEVAARSDLAAALVDAVQGLPDLLALGREPAFLSGLDEIG